MIGFLSSVARRVLQRGERDFPADAGTPPTDDRRPTRGVLPVDGVRADLRVARWDGDRLIVEGWVTTGGRERKQPPSLSVWAIPLGARDREPIADDAGKAVEPTAPTPLRMSDAPHLNPNGFVTSEHDLTAATFSASLTSDAWEQLGTSDLQIAVRFGPSEQFTPLTHRYRWGSAGHLFAHISGGRRYAPRWRKDHGLCVRRTSPAAFTRGHPVSDDGSIRIPISLTEGFHPVRVDWADEDETCSATLTLNLAGGADAEVVISMPGSRLPSGGWGIALTDGHGTRRLLHWGDASRDALTVTGSATLARRPGGLVRLLGGPRRILLDDVIATDDQIIARLSAPSRPHVTSLALRGSRMVLQGNDLGEGRFAFTLGHMSWRQWVEAPPAGGYRLWATIEDGSEVPVEPVRLLSQTTPVRTLTARTALRVEHAPDGQVYLDVSAPLRDDEQGRFHRRRLAAAHTGDRSESAAGKLEGVFLESWYGKTFSDNPAPLVSALRSVGVPGPYRVAVADRSVEHPHDVEAVIVGSEEYWRAMGTSRVLVCNTWLPSEFEKGAGQFIVQTWHGTPLKSLGMDVPSRRGSSRSAENLRQGSREWDLLVSQNSYSTAILRRAYVYDGDVAETGYPRNDALNGERGAEVRVRTRQLLGITGNSRLVLYAPTWRQADKGSVGPLDVEGFVQLLPPGHVIAVRGHSVTLRRGSDLTGDRIIDVTSYPEPAELMAAADVLVTDYSSIMFDFAATGRPIVFYTPDYAQYISEGRGGYFDLKATAPGPLTCTPEELAAALDSALPTSDTAQRYSEWQQMFVPHDDGTAADRLAQRIAAALD